MAIATELECKVRSLFLLRFHFDNSSGSSTKPPRPLARWLGKESTMPTPLHRKDEPIHYDADKARGAEIILTKRRNRVIFMAGLVCFVVLALVLNWFA